MMARRPGAPSILPSPKVTKSQKAFFGAGGPWEVERTAWTLSSWACSLEPTGAPQAVLVPCVLRPHSPALLASRLLLSLSAPGQASGSRRLPRGSGAPGYLPVCLLHSPSLEPRNEFRNHPSVWKTHGAWNEILSMCQLPPFTPQAPEANPCPVPHPPLLYLLQGTACPPPSTGCLPGCRFIFCLRGAESSRRSRTGFLSLRPRP